jgi:hypothetical protein
MNWTDAEIPRLLRGMSHAMNDEVEFVAGLDAIRPLAVSARSGLLQAV